MPLSLLIDEDTRDGGLWNAILRHNASVPEWAIDAIRVGDDDAPLLGTGPSTPRYWNGQSRPGG
jgi:hypothetical protein